MNKSTFNTWSKMWLVSHVLKSMHKLKWLQTDCDIKLCHIVLFIKHESTISSKC